VITAELEVRPLTQDERPQLRELLTREWGSTRIVSRGQLHDAAEAEAIGAFRNGQIVGLATYVTAGGDCEVLTLNAFDPGHGVGSALLKAATKAARESGCRRLWLITTNDNRNAIRFYKANGMRLVAVHEGAAEAARQIKPSIPELAADGTAITDELEFEFVLS
jgi:ribosomal protein S18 acetylase RimI-like enzyme